MKLNFNKQFFLSKVYILFEIWSKENLERNSLIKGVFISIRMLELDVIFCLVLCSLRFLLVCQLHKCGVLVYYNEVGSK